MTDVTEQVVRRMSRRSASKTLHLIAVVVYLGFIFYLSSFPDLPDIGRYGVKDWMAHGVEYFGLGAIVTSAAAVTWPWSGVACGGFAVALGAGYGVSDEFHQRFVPGRQCDIRDWTADVVGSALGAGALLTWRRLRKSFTRSGGSP